jgi:drug/metabolite transporter (DMT)-like permease
MHASATGIGAAFLTLISWTLGLIAFTEASKRISPYMLNHVRLLLAVILLSIFNWLFFGIDPIELFSLPIQEHWLWLGLSGLVGLSIGDYFAFTALKMVGARTTSLFNALAPTAALFTGMFLLEETINIAGAVGIMVSIAGIMWVILLKRGSNFEGSRADVRKAIIAAALSTICQGIGLVFAKKGMMDSDINPMHATWIRMLLAVGAIYLIELFKGNYRLFYTPLKTHPSAIKYIIAGTMLGPVIGVSLSLYAASQVEAYIAQTIFSMVPISILPVTWYYYKERINPVSWLAALIAVLGVILLSFQKEIMDFLRDPIMH